MRKRHLQDRDGLGRNKSKQESSRRGRADEDSALDADSCALSVVSDVKTLITDGAGGGAAILSTKGAEIVGIGQAEILGCAAFKGICARVTQLFAAWDKTSARGGDTNFFGLCAGDAFALVSTGADQRQTKGDIVLNTGILGGVASEPRSALSRDTASAREVDANALKVFGIRARSAVTALDAKPIVRRISEPTKAHRSRVGASACGIASCARRIIDRGGFAKPCGGVARIKSRANDFGGAAFFAATACFAEFVLCAFEPFARKGRITTPVVAEKSVRARSPGSAGIALFDTRELFFVGLIAFFARATARSSRIARERADFFCFPRDAQQIAFARSGVTGLPGLFSAVARETDALVSLELTTSKSGGALGLECRAFEAAEAVCCACIFETKHRFCARFGLRIAYLAFFGPIVCGAALREAKRLAWVFAVVAAFASVGGKAISAQALGFGGVGAILVFKTFGVGWEAAIVLALGFGDVGTFGVLGAFGAALVLAAFGLGGVFAFGVRFALRARFTTGLSATLFRWAIAVDLAGVVGATLFACITTPSLAAIGGG